MHRGVAGWFLVRTHMQVVGSIPGWGGHQEQSTGVSFSLECFSFSLFLPSLKPKSVSLGENNLKKEKKYRVSLNLLPLSSRGVSSVPPKLTTHRTPNPLYLRLFSEHSLSCPKANLDHPEDSAFLEASAVFSLIAPGFEVG